MENVTQTRSIEAPEPPDWVRDADSWRSGWYAGFLASRLIEQDYLRERIAAIEATGEIPAIMRQGCKPSDKTAVYTGLPRELRDFDEACAVVTSGGWVDHTVRQIGCGIGEEGERCVRYSSGGAVRNTENAPFRIRYSNISDSKWFEVADPRAVSVAEELGRR